MERRDRSNDLRLLLPDELRARTERHPGKWVAIAGGRIVAVGDSGSIRHAQRAHPDTEVYWVAPRAPMLDGDG